MGFLGFEQQADSTCHLQSCYLQCDQTRELSLFFRPRFIQVIFVPFLLHLALLLSHQLCEVLLLLSKKLNMKRAKVVGKLGKSLT